MLESIKELARERITFHINYCYTQEAECEGMDCTILLHMEVKGEPLSVHQKSNLKWLRLDVATLTLGSQPKQGFVRL